MAMVEQTAALKQLSTGSPRSPDLSLLPRDSFHTLFSSRFAQSFPEVWLGLEKQRHCVNLPQPSFYPLVSLDSVLPRSTGSCHHGPWSSQRVLVRKNKGEVSVVGRDGFCQA